MPATGASLHCGIPLVKTTVLIACGRIVFKTVAGTRIVIQIFRHPDLVSDFYGLVGLVIARVRHGVVFLVVYGLGVART